MEKKPTKRKGISAKTRMEVFKRDSFTCQYCGRKAPDVVLHVDHIKPVAKGGKNDIMNYVTSCVECNLGKGARELSDDSVIEKSRKQAELLQERRAQIKMLADWHAELAEQQNEEVFAANRLFSTLSKGKVCLSEVGEERFRGLISKYGLHEVLESLHAAFEGYGDPSIVLDKIEGVLICRKRPHLRRRAYIAAILRNKFCNEHYDNIRCLAALERGYAAGGDEFFDTVENWAKLLEEDSWYKAIAALEKSIPEWEKRNNG